MSYEVCRVAGSLGVLREGSFQRKEDAVRCALDVTECGGYAEVVNTATGRVVATAWKQREDRG